MGTNLKTPLAIQESARRLTSLDRAICSQVKECGKDRFYELYKKGSLLNSDDSEALRAYAQVSTFVEEKRNLIFFLLDHASVFDADAPTLRVLSMIAGDKPFESDHIIKAIIEPQPGDLVIYNLQWSYIDQDDLQNRSWDDFLGNYGLDGVIQGRLDARCLLTPVDTPKELEDIIDEMRLCFAFGQITAVFALCRTLLESAITDICLRLGHISKAEMTSDFFFKNYPPSRRIKAITRSRSDEQDEAFRLYKITSMIIHGADMPKGSRDIASRTISLVEYLYRRHAKDLHK